MIAAPTIVGELSTCSRSVRLQGQFTGADIEIVIGDSTIPLGKADWPDQRFNLPKDTALPKGAKVRARQRSGGQASELSKDAATVQEVRTGLPPPVVDAPFAGCASLLVAHGLSADATVTVKDGAGTTIGIEQAEGSRAVVALDHPVGFGQTVNVTADACGSVTSVTSPPSEPIALFTGRLPTPTLPQDPYACQRILEVTNLRPGETMVIERGDGSQARYQVSAARLLARLTPQLDPGELLRLYVETTQSCDIPASDVLSVTVSTGPPPPPLVSVPPCPGSPGIGLSGLIPSATVRLRRGAEELLTLQAAEPSQPVDLAGTALNVGDHLVVEQALCDVWSAPSPVDAVVILPEPASNLRIVEPAAECSMIVRVAGVAPGSLVSVFSTMAGGRIGHEQAQGDTVDVEVSPPLIETDVIIAVSEGCASGYASAPVVAVPDSTPVITRAVEGDRAVDVGSCRPGATIDVRVGPLWAGSKEAVGYDVRVYVRDPLPRDVPVQATARFCGKTVVGQTRDVEPRRRPAFTRVSTKGISVGTGHFHSGRVEAIAPLPGGGALLGTEASGLWLMQPGTDAIPLSHDWPDPHVRCLVRDPTTPGRWFAGTGSELRTSVPSAAQPERTWIMVPGWSQGGVNDVLVLPAHAIVVVATDQGVWRAPLAGLTFGSDPLVSTLKYTSLAMGPDESVIAYRAGTGNADGRIHLGTWSGATLSWADRTFATAPGGDGRLSEVAVNMGNGALSSSRHDRARVYLAVEDIRDEGWFPVVRSDDGGTSWFIPTAEGIRYFKPKQQGEPDRPVLDMGYQADRNLAIAAHPTQPDVVLAAGRRNGVLGSVDGATTWDAGRWGEKGDDFHGDTLCLLFDLADAGGNTVWAGGDGGVFRSVDLAVSWDNAGNEGMPTLMFDADGPSYVPSVSANPASAEVLAGGLQDNGLVFRGGPGKPWRRIEGGDGSLAKFVAADAALVIDNDDLTLHVAYWDGAALNRAATLVPAGLMPQTFVPVLGKVYQPAYRRGGDLMLMVAGNVASKTVHGLFDHKPWSHDDDRFRWELLATLPDGVTGVGTWDGRTVIAATNDSRFYRIDAASGAMVELPLAGVGKRGDPRWVEFVDPHTAVAVDSTGLLVTANLLTWQAVGAMPAGGGTGWSLAVDRGPYPAVVLVGREDGVWATTDLGTTWTPCDGLPKHPEVNHLELLVTGAKRLAHAGTWNWSAWRAELQ